MMESIIKPHSKMTTRNATKANQFKFKILILVLLSLPVIYLSTSRYLLDDAIISYRYTQNIVNGNGLVPYIGGPRVEGYSNPTLVFITAAVAKLTGTNQITGIMRIGLYLNTLALILLCWLLLKWGQDDWTWMSGFLVLLFYPTHIFRSSGLETCLYTLFFTAAVYGFSSNKIKLGVTAALFAALSRPEGIGLAVWLVIVYSWQERKNVLKKNVLILLFGLVVPFGLFLLWRYQMFGHWVSMTSIAKTHLTDRNTVGFTGLKYIFEAHKAAPFLFLASIFTVIRFARFGKKYIYELTAIAFQIFFIVVVGGDDPYFDHHRFVIPIFPFLFRSLALIPDMIPKRYREFTAIGLIICGTFFPAYRKFTKEMDLPWIHQMYNEITGAEPSNHLNALINPRPALDEYLSLYLRNHVKEAGKGYSLSSVQGGSLLIHWQGEYQDEAGLMTEDYAIVPHTNRKSVFLKLEPDIYTAFTWMSNYKGIQESIFPAFSFTVDQKTLTKAGYQPALLYTIALPPEANWGRRVQSDKALVFLLYTKEPNILNVDYVNFVVHLDYNGTVIRVPGIHVQADA